VQVNPENETATDGPETGWGRIGSWLERYSVRLIVAILAVTVLLVVPLLAMESRGVASQNPAGEVFDLQEEIDDTFASPFHPVPLILEAREGDVLTQAVLYELLQNENELRAADKRGELAVGDLPKQPYLLTYFDLYTGLASDGVTSLADAVDVTLAVDPTLNTTLAGATDEQVKVAVHRLFSSPDTETLRDTIKGEAEGEPVIVGGEEINYWTASALALNVLAENEKLGGGGLIIAVGADETVVEKERFNRRVQEVMRGDETTYRMWGIAIDVNLESADEGQVAGIFIMFTVIGAVAIVGLSLRSYWATALTGAGLGILMVWLKGISVLVGIKGGLVIDLIVPIAMVSLGVDFAIHAVRRYREERGLGFAPRRALLVGMTGVLSALVLALLSDSIAFLSNTAAGIEAVIHFGVAAAIAVVSSFVVLGVGLPLALMHVEMVQRSDTGPATQLRRLWVVVGSAGAAALAGTGVIFLIAVSVPLGLAVLAGVIAGMIVVPYLWLRHRSGTEPGAVPGQGAATAAREAVSEPGAHRATEVLARLAELRLVTLPVAAAITAAAVLFALRLEATFDVKDFFDSGSDFVISLDKLDEHFGESGGEPAVIFVEGDFTNPRMLSAIGELMVAMETNEHLARGSDGSVAVSEPTLLGILEKITGSEYASRQVQGATGVEITDADGNGIPDSPAQIRAALDYAVVAGVPRDTETAVYGADYIQVMLSHDADVESPDQMVLSVFLPGTREQSKVAAARGALEDNMKVLDGVPGITRTGLTGSAFTRQEQLQASVDSMQKSIPIAAAGAFVLLLLAMRSFRYAVVTIIPIGLVVGWLYGLMHVSGFALNFVTATIGAVSIGVGVDYSIHMTERFREELRRTPTRGLALRRALDGTGLALVASALSSIVGFAIMGLAPMPMFSTYGILTAIMIFLALVASLAVLPSLLLLVASEPERETARDAAAAD